MGIVPAMVFVREGGPFCSKLIEELQKNGFDFQIFDIDNMESRKYLEDAGMQVRVPPLFQTPDNYYVLPDFLSIVNLRDLMIGFLPVSWQD